MTYDWVHKVGQSLAYQILLQSVVRTVITSSSPAWTSSAGMLLTAPDFPLFNDCTQLFCVGWGGNPLYLSEDKSVLTNLHWPCSCTAQSSILSIGSVSFVLLGGIFLSDLGQS